MKLNCLVDLSSGRELCLESGDLYLDLPGDLNLFVDGVGFVDLHFLDNFQSPLEFGLGRFSGDWNPGIP